MNDGKIRLKQVQRIIAVNTENERINISGGTIVLVYNGQPIDLDKLEITTTPVVRPVQRKGRVAKGEQPKPVVAGQTRKAV